MFAALVAADCDGRLAPDRFEPECTERADAALGVVFLIAFVVVIAVTIYWRRVNRRDEDD